MNLMNEFFFSLNYNLSDVAVPTKYEYLHTEPPIDST